MDLLSNYDTDGHPVLRALLRLWLTERLNDDELMYMLRWGHSGSQAAAILMAWQETRDRLLASSKADKDG